MGVGRELDPVPRGGVCSESKSKVPVMRCSTDMPYGHDIPVVIERRYVDPCMEGEGSIICWLEHRMVSNHEELVNPVKVVCLGNLPCRIFVAFEVEWCGVISS